MIKLKLALVITGLAVALSLPQAQAQDSTVTLALKAYQQGPDNTNSLPVVKHSLSITPFTTQTLLGLIATALETNFPAGAKLVMQGYDTFRVEAADGTVLQTLDSELINADYGPFPFSGFNNTETGQSKYRYAYILTINFDAGSENNFVLRGFVLENYSQSAANNNGQRVILDTFLMTASGDGTLNGASVVFNGKIKGRSRAVTAPL